MSKRLNPYRRAAAMAAQVRLQAHHATVAYNMDADAGLQQGRVRSPLTTIYRGHVPPHPAVWEGRGTPGKIVRGQLQRTRPDQKARFNKK